MSATTRRPTRRRADRPPPEIPGRSRTGAAPRGDSAYPEILSALAAMATATPAVPQLADALAERGIARGRPELAAILRGMERHELVESWPDPIRAGVARVMLSAVAARRLGLALAPKGDRWLPGVHTCYPPVPEVADRFADGAPLPGRMIGDRDAMPDAQAPETPSFPTASGAT